MEMTAIIAALDYIGVGKEAVIRSDSQLCINQLTKGWRANANQDLVQRARTLAAERPAVRFEWVRGHSGEQWNEYVDCLAREAVLAPRELPNAPMPCVHVTDQDLANWYEENPASICARCWFDRQ